MRGVYEIVKCEYVHIWASLSFIINLYTIQEVLDNHGKKREEEMVAYEARLFSEMLLKGAVNIFEVRSSSVSF